MLYVLTPLGIQDQLIPEVWRKIGAIFRMKSWTPNNVRLYGRNAARMRWTICAMTLSNGKGLKFSLKLAETRLGPNCKTKARAWIKKHAKIYLSSRKKQYLRVISTIGVEMALTLWPPHKSWCHHSWMPKFVKVVRIDNYGEYVLGNEQLIAGSKTACEYEAPTNTFKRMLSSKKKSCPLRIQHCIKAFK